MRTRMPWAVWAWCRCRPVHGHVINSCQVDPILLMTLLSIAPQENGSARGLRSRATWASESGLGQPRYSLPDESNAPRRAAMRIVLHSRLGSLRPYRMCIVACISQRHAQRSVNSPGGSYSAQAAIAVRTRE